MNYKPKRSDWKLYNGVLIPDLPPHVNIELDRQSAEQLIKHFKAYFIRFTTDFDSKLSYPFWYVIKDKREDVTLQSYSSKIRYEIKRGLKNTHVELIDNRESMIEKLHRLYLKAFKRYTNIYTDILDLKSFSSKLLEKKEESDLWIARSKQNKELIGFAIVKKQKFSNDLVVNYSMIKLDPDYLRLYPAYALIFEMNRFYLNECKVMYVHDGARSLGHDTSIHAWLEKKFKFRKAYAKLNIFYRPDVKILANLCNISMCKKFIYLLEPKNKLFKKLSILLKHEEIRKSCLLIGSGQ